MKKLKILYFMMALLILVGVSFATVPTYTKISDGNSWFMSKIGIGTDTPTAMLHVDQDDTTGNGLYVYRDFSIS